jgi:Asp-tRNA(Asn)/Glu-tRNA(Gln) amidotransferase A subunit family amidase
MNANPLPEGASKRALVDLCLERILDPSGEGARVFRRVYDEAARLAAHRADELPVGLMLTCMNGQDHGLLAIAKAFETLLRAAAS